MSERQEVRALRTPPKIQAAVSRPFLFEIDDFHNSYNFFMENMPKVKIPLVSCYQKSYNVNI